MYMYAVFMYDVYVCMVVINFVSEKEKNWLQFILDKRILFQDNVLQQQQNCFYKKWHGQIEIDLNNSIKKGFCFCFSL